MPKLMIVQEEPVTGTMRCSKFPGGMHLVCDVDWVLVKQPMHEHLIWSYDPEAKGYSWYDIDDTGFAGRFRGQVKDKVWTWMLETSAGGKKLKLRSVWSMQSPKAFTVKNDLWQGEGPWSAQLTATFTKTK
jgi:hypothetical protein